MSIFLAIALSLVCLWVSLAPAAIAVPIAIPIMAQAARPSPVQVLEQLFQTGAAQAAWFDPRFLRQIPIRQIQTLLGSLKRAMGGLQSVVPVADGYELTFEQGTVPAKMRLNDQGQIEMLFFGPPEGPIDLAEAAQTLQDFDGSASLLVLAGDQVLAAVNADAPLAVGSAFKLVVLTALQAAIAQDRLQWQDVVTLKPEWRSLPSGLLQTWPVGTAMTLESLATLMISISDNTAADALIDTVGREALEALSPRNQPFFSTREFFALKHPANADRLQAFRAALEPAAKRTVLEATATAALPPVSLFAGAPIALDIEWQLTTRELCQLMAQVRDLPLMAINPGVANPERWAAIAFKGGSEPGVLNLTTGLTAADGQTYCVAATWNNPERALDEVGLTRLYAGIISGLQRQ